MNAALINQLKSIIASDEFKQIAKETGKIVGIEIMKSAGEKLKAYDKQRTENIEDGMNSEQSFNRELRQYDEIEGNYSDSTAKEIFNNTFSQLEAKFELADNDLYMGFKEYKSYLEGSITEEEETELVNKLYVAADEALGERGLRQLIGEDNYKMLLTMMIRHSMNISNEVYQFGQNKITEFQLKENMKVLYENYVLAILDFVKNNPLVREHGLTILMLAFGPKTALIQGIVFAVAMTALDKEQRTEMMDAFNTVKTKLTERTGMEKEHTEKHKESDYENFES